MTETLIEVLVGDQVYDLSDDASFIFEGEDNWGMAPVQRLTEQGPNQHGATDRGFRLQPRIFHMAVPGLADLVDDHYTLRDRLIEIFAPADDAISIRRTRPDGLVRQIDCHYMQGLEFSSNDRLGNSQRNVIQLMAPDPTLYDPVGVTVSFALAGGGGSGSIPLVVPMAVGASTLDQTTVVSYPGTWNASPIAVVTGPATDPVITHQGSGAKLDFTGNVLAAGHTWTIDTRYEHGLVYLDGDTSQSVIDKLTDDSDLGTFALLRAREAAGGLNPIRFTASSVTTASRLDLTYLARYLGM